MIRKRLTDYSLFGAVMVVTLAGAASLTWSLVQLRQRQLDLSELDLARTQQMLRVRLDGMFHEWSEDLREEAAAASHIDSTHQPLDRWLPLLSSNWSIFSIRLADELGNETAVYREDSAMELVVTREGSRFDMTWAARLNADGIPDTVHRSWTVLPDYDPRERIWFSKALEDGRDEPIWSLKQTGDTLRPLLQISYLIRAVQDSVPYRIIVFDVDLRRSNWVDTRSSLLAEHGAMLMNDEGRPLNLTDPDKGTLLSLAGLKAVTVWTANKTRTLFSVDEGGDHFRALISPYTLNGQTLYTVVLIDLSQVRAWTAPERTNLWIMAAIMALLIVLLIALWVRRRRVEESRRQQDKRNRSQERRLTKALGEREVLNREVHHRVKNNLQVVSSLLNLQAMRLEDGAVREEFLRGKRRIDTIALVHHKLYGLTDLRNVDLDLFFTGLIEALGEMHLPKSGTVSREVQTNGVKADQDTAIELGIILCELVSNAFQHAFPYATGGHIDVQLKPVEGDLYRLVVKDNGKGLPDGYASGSGKLGLEIVEALAEQLDGAFHTRTNGGVTFEVVFRMRREQVQTGPAEEAV
ncbi:MAG: sensor histidine kinase [Flavobacteriales bacterium]